MTGTKVHLLDLTLRTSAAGNQYLSGWLGKAAVVGFRDREAEGEVWQIFVSTPTPRSAGSSDVPREASQSPFTPQPRRARSTGKRKLEPGELDDRLDDL